MSILVVAKDQASDLFRRRYLLVILIGCMAVIGMWIGYLALMKNYMAMAQNVQVQGGHKPNAAEMGQMSRMMIGGLQVALLGLVNSIATVLSLTLMCYSVRSEVAKGTFRMILSRPVRRYEFFVGKWLGCVSIVFVFSLFMGILVSIYTYYAFGGLEPIVPISLALGFLKAIMVGSVGMAVAMFIHPLPALIVTFLAAGETFLFMARFSSGAAKAILNTLFYVLPSYKAFDVHTGIVTGTSVSGEEIAYRCAYAVLLSMLMLLAGTALFQRRDLA